MERRKDPAGRDSVLTANTCAYVRAPFRGDSAAGRVTEASPRSWHASRDLTDALLPPPAPALRSAWSLLGRATRLGK